MQLDKQEVVDLLRKEGKNEHVQKALQELPDKIDHERDAAMLRQKSGIDPGTLAAKAIGQGSRSAPGATGARRAAMRRALSWTIGRASSSPRRAAVKMPRVS